MKRHQVGARGYTQQEVDSMKWARKRWRRRDVVLNALAALYAAILLIGVGIALGVVVGVQI